MAIDTRDRRASVLGYSLAPLRVYFEPDGDMAEEADRTHLATLYSGIFASGAGPDTGDAGIVLSFRRRR